MGKPALIRELRAADCAVVAQAFANQGWPKPQTQYEKYCQEQCDGKRVVLAAEVENIFAGYLTILWESHYQPFKQTEIPEVEPLFLTESDRKKDTI